MRGYFKRKVCFHPYLPILSQHTGIIGHLDEEFANTTAELSFSQAVAHKPPERVFYVLIHNKPPFTLPDAIFLELFLLMLQVDFIYTYISEAILHNQRRHGNPLSRL